MHRAWIEQARLQSDQADRQAAEARIAFEQGGAPIFAADHFPGYELEREIHRGAQGVVYRAVQKSTSRRVALKLLHDHAFGGSLERARFEREMRVLATVQHPNIVAIHDGGSHDGRVFLVMDYIAGQPLDVYMASQPRSIRETLDLFIAICDAVNAAHVRGIIHRDLKPANVRVDATGRPFVLDFGLAKLTGAALDSATAATGSDSMLRIPKSALTMTGQFLGSVPWSAPEQAEGSPTRIDLRTDVYSLGVLLYQMLTGKFPYPVVGPMKQVFESILHASPTAPRSLRHEIDDELETIVLKCLNKEQERRYQIGGELAADLRRYLAGEPIEAKRDSTWYLLKKTLHRYRRRAAVAAAFVLVVFGATIALSILYARQGRLLVEVAHQRDMADYESYVANIAAADAAIAAGDGGAALSRLQTVPAELRNWEWHYLIRQADQSVATWSGPQGMITGRVRVSPGRLYVGASFWMEERGSALRVWPRASPSAIAEFSSSARWVPFEFNAGGNQVLFLNRDGAVSHFDLVDRRETDHRPVAALGHGQRAMEFSPDGRILAISTGQGIRLWDTVADLLLQELALSGDRWVNILSFDAGGKRLAAGLNDGTIILWDGAGEGVLAQTKAHAGQVYGVAFSRDGGLLATAGGEDGEIKIWDLGEHSAPPETTTDRHAPSLRMIREMHDGGQRNGAISFSPDGKLLAVPSEDKTVRIWTVAEGEVRATLLGHATGVVCTAFSSDGHFVVSGAREGVVKLWDLEKSPAVRAFRELPDILASIAFTPDGARLLIRCGITACVADFASGRWIHERRLSPAPAFGGILPGPGGAQATFSAADGSIQIWNFETEQEPRVIGTHRSVPRLAGNPSGRILASADAETIVLWDWAEGRESRRFVGPGERVRSLALSHDAARLALGLETGELIICNTRTGERTPMERAHGGSVTSAAFSPDGRNLATGSDDGTVKLWDVATGRVRWSASPHLGDVWCVAFSPDGTRLAAGGRDRSVRVFDPRTGREMLALRGPTGTVMCVAFSPDGHSIVAGSWAREVFAWDTGHAYALLGLK
ncbi:MAG: protein kinase [Phycisphaerales bacterium]|nr:protein kinase [Phycisphaerales bacterium]